MADLKSIIQDVLVDKQARDINVITMNAVSPYTDYFMICTANNIRHASSLADYVQKAAVENGYQIRAVEGDKNSTWILVDLYDVIVHIFTEETREQYRLELLWADQPQERIVES